MPYSARIRLQGAVLANGAPLPASRLRIGFVQQDDLFYPQVGGLGYPALPHMVCAWRWPGQ